MASFNTAIFQASRKVLGVRAVRGVTLPTIGQGVIAAGQWRLFAAMLGIREKKEFAWFYTAAFEIELSWAAPTHDDDNVAMPRATLLPTPAHPPARDCDGQIPFYNSLA